MREGASKCYIRFTSNLQRKEKREEVHWDKAPKALWTSLTQKNKNKGEVVQKVIR